jgi:hypothetical protein
MVYASYDVQCSFSCIGIEKNKKVEAQDIGRFPLWEGGKERMIKNNAPNFITPQINKC